MFTTAGVAFRGAFDFGRTTLGFNAPAQGLGGLVGGAAYAGTTTGQNGSALISGQTYLQIFKYQRSGGSYAAMEWLLSESQFATFKAGGLTEQELNLALIGTGPTNVWSRVSVNGLSTGGIEQVTFASQSGFGIDPKGIIQDELRISNTSIDDATPAIVPEPAAFALICCGILCLVRHRRPS